MFLCTKFGNNKETYNSNKNKKTGDYQEEVSDNNPGVSRVVNENE